MTEPIILVYYSTAEKDAGRSLRLAHIPLTV